LFSVQHETGTFDFQRVLPANQSRVFWAKIGFALASAAVLAILIALFTRGVFVPTLPRDASWFRTFGVLYLAEVFVWSLLASLIIKQPSWGLCASVTAQSLTLYSVLPYFYGPMRFSGDWPAAEPRLVPVRIGIIVVIAAADLILGKLWFEDRLRLPRWRFRRKPDVVSSYPSDIELPLYVGQRQIGWSRLLWLGWR